MRNRIAALTVLGLGLAIVGQALAGDDKTNASSKGNATASQAKTETIRGVIAGVTTEGETAIDAKAHRAVTVEAAFLTVVGSPKPMMDDKAAGSKPDASNSAHHRRRDNVYMVWLSPRTKVRDASANVDGKSEAKKDVTIEQLELGDRVEIEFNCRDDANSGSNNANASAQKHGRHRVYMGDATLITILPAMHHHANANASPDASKDKAAGNDASKSK
jgi:hypothetical protein